MKLFRFALPSAALALLALRGATLSAQEKQPTPVPAGTPVTITVQPPTPTAPPFSIVLHGRHGHVTPLRSGCTHTGGGNIDIAQPSSDTVIITATGVAVAYPFFCPSAATMQLTLEQCFEITFDNPKIKKAKLSMEGRVLGLLRGGKGTASYSEACANVEGANTVLVGIEVPPHAVSGCENLSVNDHKGPISVPIVAGKYILHQTFNVTAAAPCALLPCKGPSAEFAPDPALDPLWISYREPFHGAAKKDFGFQVTVKVIEDTEPENGDKGEDKTDREKLPPPKIESVQ